jgi:hypothetical protein
MYLAHLIQIKLYISWGKTSIYNWFLLCNKIPWLQQKEGCLWLALNDILQTYVTQRNHVVTKCFWVYNICKMKSNLISTKKRIFRFINKDNFSCLLLNLKIKLLQELYKPDKWLFTLGWSHQTCFKEYRQVIQARSLNEMDSWKTKNISCS